MIKNLKTLYALKRYRKLATAILSVLSIAILLTGCFSEAKSRPNLIFRPAPKKGIIANILGKDITEQEFYQGIESEIFEAEQKLYELKLDRLKAILLKELVNSAPEKKNLSNDEFLEKYISKGRKISDKEISKFAEERKIPTPELNNEVRERIRKYLDLEMKKAAVDEWMNTQTKKRPVQIYFEAPKRPVFDVSIDNSPFWGDPDAKVTIIEFIDFNCPYCANATSLLEKIKKDYGSKVKIVIKNFPLPFHPYAKEAAMASLCANEQGIKYFWKMYQHIFSLQENYSPAILGEGAKSIGLDINNFEKCMREKRFMSKIVADLKQGELLGIKATPTFFINGQLVRGIIPYNSLTEIIDNELSK